MLISVPCLHPEKMISKINIALIFING